MPISEQSLGEAELYLATVTVYSSDNGVKIRLDGHDSAMTKYYKTCVPVNAGDRVVVMKYSGTFIVLGAIVESGSYVVRDPTEVFTMAPGFECSWVYYAKWGRLAMVTAVFKVVNAVTTTDWTTWATLVEGKRPPIRVVASFTRTSYCTVESNGEIQVSSTVNANTNYSFSAVYLLP